MQEIDKIYSNEIGISFYWNTPAHDFIDKVQLIFRDIGFLLTLAELKSFASACSTTYTTSNCRNCRLGNDCRNLLLKTPSNKIDIAISLNELDQVSSLLDATILKVELRSWINSSYN